MARSYKRKYKNNNEDEVVKIISGIVVVYFVCLIFSYNSNRSSFWQLLIGGILFAGLIFFGLKYFRKSKEQERKKKINNILTTIDQAGLESYIDEFITRFGLGQEKDKNVWTRRNYKISADRIDDLQKILFGKGIDYSLDEIHILLSTYIDKREFDLTRNSIATTTNSFSKLSGSDFENLLYHLYVAMGYSVQLIGKTGDQGGDLIATKNQERILIQAKCYKDWNVGNSAVQEAAAAKKHHDCNKAMVITTSNFTREAMELAKTNYVELIPQDLLQKMLLDNLKESWS